MSGSSVTFEGWPQAAADMHRWAGEVGPAVDRGTRDVAERIASTAANAAPVLTGTFAGSVEVLDLEGAGDGLTGWAVGIGGGVPYGLWLEFGGSHGRPHSSGRYLYPAAHDAEDDYSRQAADAAADSAERFSWHHQH